MIRITCPFCGERDHSEFSYGGDATIQYPPLDAPEKDWFEAVYLRGNPRGWHSEYWHHVSGCRAWLIVERNTQTHEVRSTRFAHDGFTQTLETSA